MSLGRQPTEPRANPPRGEDPRRVLADASAASDGAGPEDPCTALPPGTVLGQGRYTLVDRIGVGGMATVYEAQDHQAQRRVALKILTGKYRTRADAQPRLFNEARYANVLPSHPLIVHSTAAGHLPELDDRPFVALELTPGPVLGVVIIFETPMAIPRVCQLLGDVAQALSDLHAQGVVHRDLKSTNVIVTSEAECPRAKLIDFGLATVVGDQAGADTDLTAHHDRPGSKRYMAPEQALGLAPTPAFDVYAFGVLLHEALVGATPWHHRSEQEVVRRKTDPHQPPFTLGTLRTDVPAPLRALVDGCLAYDPAARPTMAQARATLAELCRDAADTAPSADPAGPSAASSVPATAAAANLSPESPAETTERLGHEVASESITGKAGAKKRLAAVLAGSVAALGLGLWWQTATPRRGANDAAVVGAGLEGAPGSAGASEMPASQALAAATGPTLSVRAGSAAEPQPDRDRDQDRDQDQDRQPAIEPEPVPAPEPHPDPAPRSAPALPPAPSAWKTPACARLRGDTEAALAAGNVDQALQLLDQRRCWANPTEHRILLMHTLTQAKRFKQCVRAGQGFHSPEIEAALAFCRSRL